MKKQLLICLLLFGGWATAQSIGAAEYFIDGPDPGLGNGTPLMVNSNSGELTQEFSIPTVGLSDGFHSLYVRTQISGGNWGLYDRTVFFISRISDVSQAITTMEYFFDDDPGLGNGTPLALDGNMGSITQSFSIPTTNLTEGFHSLYIRTQNTEGTWSLYDRTMFYIGNFADKNEPITAAEYFFDVTDPGFGNATPLILDENTGQLTQSLSLPTDGLTAGPHTVYIRVRTESGIWSLYDTATFTIDSAAIDNTVTQIDNLLTANFVASGATYQWLDCGSSNVAISDANDSSFTATQTGTYAVQISFNGQTVISPCLTVEIVSVDDDNDGILNVDDLCPNTPSGVTVGFDGCEIFSLPTNNFTIQTVGESCIGNNDGELRITATEPLNYTASITGPVSETQTFTETISFINLTAGEYQVCITVEGKVNFEQCFAFTISQPEALGVSSKLNALEKTITLTLEGSSNYTITLNDKVFSTNERAVTLPLDKVENTLSVTGEKGCQGDFEEIIVISESMFAYPNPLVDETLVVYLGSNSEFHTISATLFTLSGTKVITNKIIVNNGYVQMDLGKLPQGVYLLSLKNKKTIFTHKVIKK